MFGNSSASRRLDSLEKELSTLREYTIKLTTDVNEFANRATEKITVLEARITKLEEK